MAKKVCWISIPLATASEANDAAVVSFLKRGQKKELEVETAAFITKWMSDKSVPFHIDAERSSPERNRVVAPAPQGAPESVTVPVIAKADEVIKAQNVAEHSSDTAVDQIAEGAVVVAVPAGPDSQVDASGGVGLRRARGKAGRRVPEASKAEE